MVKDKKQPEVADVFRRYGQEYRQCHFLSSEQFKIMRLIEMCRTAELGGIPKHVIIVVLNRMPITPAGTGTVQNARHL